jgi:hypothetical protein
MPRAGGCVLKTNSRGMTSTAVRDFCTATREAEILRARRKEENQQALQARKAAEQLLLETLGSGARCQVTVDDQPFVVATKVRETFPSFTSSVTDKLQRLWEDTDVLRERLEASDGDDVVSAVVALLLREAGGAPRLATRLELTPLRKGADKELASLPRECAEIAAALVRARADLGRGKSEFSDETKRLQRLKASAEEALVQELSVLEQGQVKRVNMLEADGSTQSYYLRLKRPKAPTKRKITVKTLRSHMERLLAEEVDPMQVGATLDAVCQPEFGSAFLEKLKDHLAKHEAAGMEDKETATKARVALDRIRAPKHRTAERPAGPSSVQTPSGQVQ